MVAIKPAHVPISDKDLWPGLPWTWEDTLRIKDECRQRAIDSGITEEPYLYFAAEREWEKYLNSFPRYGDRQKIMRLVKHRERNFGMFTEEEWNYLLEKLVGVNDPVGQSVADKISKFLAQ